MRNITEKVFEKKLYVTDGVEMVRTEPTKNAYRGFIRTVDPHEVEVPYHDKLLNDTLLAGHEVTKKEYDEFEPAVSHV